MQFSEPKKYAELMDRILDGEDVDQDELDAAMKEYEEALTEATEKSQFWVRVETSEEKSLNTSVASIVSRARNAEKKKATPLGAPKGKAEEGR